MAKLLTLRGVHEPLVVGDRRSRRPPGDPATGVGTALFHLKGISEHDRRAGMTGEQLREMVDQGMEAGFHSCSRTLLAREPHHQSIRELLYACRRIAAMLKCACIRLACSVDGRTAVNADLLQPLREADYRYSCTFLYNAHPSRVISPVVLSQQHIGKNLTVPLSIPQLAWPKLSGCHAP